MHFVDVNKAVDRVPRKVLEWVVRKDTRSVMSLYEGMKTGVWADSSYQKTLWLLW